MEARMGEPLIYRIEDERDLAPLLEQTRRIVGKKCWRAKPTYGEAIYLDIGDKLITSRYGEHSDYEIFTAGTQFSIQRGGVERFLSDRDWESAYHHTLLLEYRIVVGVDIDLARLNLQIDFDDDYSLHVLVRPEDDAIDFPYWRLQTPEMHLIEVGPNREWWISLDGKSRFD
jgi:hypothetical protein